MSNGGAQIRGPAASGDGDGNGNGNGRAGQPGRLGRPPTRLENLPPEIRREVLLLLGFDELRAIVHASPIFHQQYLLERRSLLCRSLQCTLGPVFVDAWAVSQTSADRFPKSTPSIVEFLAYYRDEREAASNQTITGTLAEEDAVQMASFLSSIIQPLMHYYVGWALAHLPSEAGGSRPVEAPSRAEEIRLMRALYRFQLCCNLFGPGPLDPRGEKRSTFQFVDLIETYTAMLYPWEVEEMACIYVYAKDTYRQALDDIAWKMHLETVQSQSGPSTAASQKPDSTNDWIQHCRLREATGRGLELLQAVLFDIRDDEHLAEIMHDPVPWPKGKLVEKDGRLILAAHRTRLWEKLFIRRANMQRARQVTVGRHGDEMDEDMRLKSPAWERAGWSYYSDPAAATRRDSIRRWGYIMWDGPRLCLTGAMAILERDWIFNDTRRMANTSGG
ncbi:hypothetical protein GQ53DRAFT_803627 [Thozetella sp. PMI_491]|nr:hypothetical protein GQ53DRAFT_803627 [Thozetella sp. PMI_491]